MKREIAIFDMDDTLFSFTKGFAEFAAKELNEPRLLNPETFWDELRRVNGANHEDKKYKLFNKFEHLSGMKILDLIEPTFTILKNEYNAGRKIFILTARGWMIDGESASTSSLAKHGVLEYVDELHIIDLDQCKGEYIKDLSMVYDVVSFYDDHEGHIARAAPYVRNCWLVDRPWNQDIESIPNVNRYYPGW